LGCNYDINDLKIAFPPGCTNNENIVTLFDTANMIKLIRNTFGEKKKFLDFENNEINFEDVQNVCFLQEKEGCHLANKLRNQHILYFKQKMKAILATQLLSQSVADALRFCKDKLKIDEFHDVGATITFIQMFNRGFDILNSRSINCNNKM